MCRPAQEKRHVKIEKSVFYFSKTLVFVVQLLRIFDSQTPPSLPFGFWVSQIPGFVVFYFLHSSNHHAGRGRRGGGGKGKPASRELEIATSETPKSLFYCGETLIFASQPGSPAQSGLLDSNPAGLGPARFRCIDMI